jgi:hypothetical protein
VNLLKSGSITSGAPYSNATLRRTSAIAPPANHERGKRLISPSRIVAARAATTALTAVDLRRSPAQLPHPWVESP